MLGMESNWPFIPQQELDELLELYRWLRDNPEPETPPRDRKSWAEALRAGEREQRCLVRERRKCAVPRGMPYPKPMFLGWVARGAQKMTLKDLRFWAKRYGIPVSGPKAQVIQRFKEAYAPRAELEASLWSLKRRVSPALRSKRLAEHKEIVLRRAEGKYSRMDPVYAAKAEEARRHHRDGRDRLRALVARHMDSLLALTQFNATRDEVREIYNKAMGLNAVAYQSVAIADLEAIKLRLKAGSLAVDEGPEKPYVFRKVGEEMYELRFLEESDYFSVSVGLAYIHHLLIGPGEERTTEDFLREILGRDVHLFPGAPVSDKQAVDQYRDRYRDAKKDLEEAEKNNDPAAKERARQEIEAIEKGLRETFPRKTSPRKRELGSQEEKERLRIGNAIRFAIEKIKEKMPNCANHLEYSIRPFSGQRRGYRPGEPIAWLL